MTQNISIEVLYNKCAEKYPVFSYKENREAICVMDSDLTIKTQFNKYVKINYIFRHKTNKNLIKITAVHKNIKRSITVTTDHICMVYNKDRFFENLAAKYIKKYDTVSISYEGKDLIGEIINIEDLGPTTEYVYDLEVADEKHVFYADDILVHNSLFINVGCITDKYRDYNGLPVKLKEWDDKHKIELWDICSDVANQITFNIRQKLIEECYCEDTDMLRYELEYLSDVGIYQAKKHYGVHKIVEEGPIIVDKIKYVGLEMRKATLPESIKTALEDVYVNTFEQNWNELDFQNYINITYNKFSELTPQDIARWMGYGTAKAVTGFLQLEKGATIIARAAEYYNQLIKKLRLNDKYEEIRIGDKVRLTYLIPTNIYAIDCIAFHDGAWPIEFNDLFQIDYSMMFEKSVISPLKNFMLAAKYKMIKPGREIAFDIFDI